MGGALDWLQKEWGVIWRAPVTFVVGAIIVAGSAWVGATVFYKQEVATAKQETSEAKQETQTVAQQRDFFKDRLDAQVKSPPSTNQGIAPAANKPPVLIRPKSPDAPKVVSSMPPPPASANDGVTSYFQSGGITAKTVNLGPQQRVLTDEIKRQLLENVPKDKPVAITALLGDSEAIVFATDLFSFMKANGFKMAEDGISQGVFSGPVIGTNVQLGPDKTTVVVGANLPPRP